MSLLVAPAKTEDPRMKLQELLRVIRHELVRERSALSEPEQRLLIAVVVAEVELGRADPLLRRVDHALDLADGQQALSPFAQRGRGLLQRVLAD